MTTARKLAELMLEWEDLQQKILAAEDEIKFIVLQMAKTQTIGNVRATYSSGTTKYDYEKAAKDQEIYVPPDVWDVTIDKNTKRVTNWREVCKALTIDPIVESKSDPYVKVKLLA